MINFFMTNNGTKWGWYDSLRTQWHFYGFLAKNAWSESNPNKLIRQKQTEEHFPKHLACSFKNKSRETREHIQRKKHLRDTKINAIYGPVLDPGSEREKKSLNYLWEHLYKWIILINTLSRLNLLNLIIALGSVKSGNVKTAITYFFHMFF